MEAKSPILQKILNDTYTLSQLNKRVHSLKTYLLKKLFESNTNELDEEIQKELSWLSSLGDEFYQQFNQQNVYKIFEELEKQIKEMESLILYLPFDPNQNQLNQIGTKLRKDYGDSFIFDIKYDPQLIGGTALVWKGLYKDYSLRATIREKSQSLLESFKQAIGSHV